MGPQLGTFLLLLLFAAAAAREVAIDAAGRRRSAAPAATIDTLQTQLLFATPVMRFEIGDTALGKDLARAALRAYEKAGTADGTSKDSSATGSNEVFWNEQTSKAPGRSVREFRKTRAFRTVRDALVEAAAGMLEALGRGEGAEELVGGLSVPGGWSDRSTLLTHNALPDCSLLTSHVSRYDLQRRGGEDSAFWWVFAFGWGGVRIALIRRGEGDARREGRRRRRGWRR